MIAGPGSYRIADFIPFSRAVFLNILENYNAAVWPVQLVWLAAGVATVYLVWGRRDGLGLRLALGLAAGAWLWVGVVFHAGHFLAVNPGARYFAGVFAAQGVVLLVCCAAGGRFALARAGPPCRCLGLTVFAFAALVPVGLLLGRGCAQVMLYGWGADATALGTLGLALALRPWWARALLTVVPVVWLVLAALMYYGFGTG